MAKAPDPDQNGAWADQFHRDGYLFLRHVLTPAMVEALKSDLDRGLLERKKTAGAGSELLVRMMETSAASLALFDMEPVVTIAEALLGDDCHVIMNTGIRTPCGAGFHSWHQDDPAHFLVTHGDPPTNVHLPVLLFTAHYYLTDVEAVEHGPTQVVPGSHLFGAKPARELEGTPDEGRIESCLGPAGSLVLFNNQVWHCGATNRSDRVRHVVQLAYGRRIIGHKYAPFMNFVMPEHVYEGANPRLQRLLGFLPGGAYG